MHYKNISEKAAFMLIPKGYVGVGRRVNNISFREKKSTCECSILGNPDMLCDTTNTNMADAY